MNQRSPRRSRNAAGGRLSHAASESREFQSAKADFIEVLRREPLKSHHPKSLVEFFRQSPLVLVELELERDPEEGRSLTL